MHDPNTVDLDAGMGLREWADQVADRFEAAWKNGPPPRIRDYLGDTSGERRRALLRELVKIDLDYRRKRGIPRGGDDYVREFPELSGMELTAPGGRTNSPASAGGDLEATGDAAPAAAPLPEALDKYRIIDLLDKGGQAEVYRAIHPALSREVAIKISRRPLAADHDAFLMEGKVLADLDHPNLVRVYDLGFHENRPFLVMEYVRGRNLKQFAADEPLPPRRAARLVAQVARALAVAHRRGIAHLDLKPKNILMDEAGRPRVIDFGLARLRHAWADDPPEAEGISGTVPYMAPEQACGLADQVGPRSDLYGLGAVLYFLLVHQDPIVAPNFAAALDRARRGDFDRDRLRAVRVPRRLKAICLKAMSARLADRHATAEELAGDLEAWARRPLVLGLLASATAALALLLAAFAWWPVPAAPPPLTVRVWRDQRWYPTVTELAPLRTDDHLQIRAKVPKGLHVSMFLINARGELQLLKAFPPQPAPLELVYPEEGQGTRLQGPAGTECVLVCGRRSGPVSIDEVRQARDTAGGWPSLPDGSVLRLAGRTVSVEQRARDLGPARALPDPEGAVQGRLEALARALYERGCEYLNAVAFAHGE